MELYSLKNGKPEHLLWAFSTTEWEDLRNGLSLFKSRTGIFVDDYSDTKFSSGLEVLIGSIKESESYKTETGIKLVKLLQTSSMVIFVGD